MNFGTSQRANARAIVEKGLLVRVHRRPVCGFIIDRDVNAAFNFLKRAHEAGQVASMNQEAHLLTHA
jgi:transposase